MKRCSTPSVTRKMQIKTMRRHHYTLTTMVDVKKANDTSVGEDVKQLQLSRIVGGNTKRQGHCGPSLAVSYI